MALFIPTACTICSADTHLTVPQRKDGTPKGRIKMKCLECEFEKEIFIDVSPTKRRSPDDRKNFMS